MRSMSFGSTSNTGSSSYTHGGQALPPPGSASRKDFLPAVRGTFVSLRPEPRSV